MATTTDTRRGPATLADVVDHRTTLSPDACCAGKRRYGQRQAHRDARRLRDRTGEGLHAYPCPFGQHWHVGHDVPQVLPAAPTDIDVDADRLDRLARSVSPAGRRTDRWYAAAAQLGLPM